MSRQVLVVATISGFIKSFEMNDISILQEMGYSIHVATNIAEGDEEFFAKRGIKTHQIEFQRFPFMRSNFEAIKSIKKIIRENNVSLVHCHTPVGSVIARLAAKKFRKNGCKVIYTVHGLQFYKGAPKKDWLIYYPVERFLSRYTDAIITINHEDHQLVLKKFHNKKTYYIPGVGVDLHKFGNVGIDRNAKRKELGLSENDNMLLSVGELIPRKNHQTVISAIKKTSNPNIKYFVAGNGPLMETLHQQIVDLDLQSQVVLLGYRTDINELLKCTDIFAIPSKQEGLSVALMESMAGGLPIVCSKIRGNIDLVDNEQGGYLCDKYDESAYAKAIKELADNPDLCKKMGDYNREKIQGFSIEVVDKKMRNIYAEIISE